MFPVEAFENTIGKFVAIAEAIGLPFHITGGSISSAYGEPSAERQVAFGNSAEGSHSASCHVERRTVAMTEAEELTQRKSKWLIEHFAAISWYTRHGALV